MAKQQKKPEKIFHSIEEFKREYFGEEEQPKQIGTGLAEEFLRRFKEAMNG